jgi:hypothetical protein
MIRTRRKILQEGNVYLSYKIAILVETGHQHDDCLVNSDNAFYNELQLLNEEGEPTAGNLYQCNCCGKIVGL